MTRERGWHRPREAGLALSALGGAQVRLFAWRHKPARGKIPVSGMTRPEESPPSRQPAPGRREGDPSLKDGCGARAECPDPGSRFRRAYDRTRLPDRLRCNRLGVRRVRGDRVNHEGHVIVQMDRVDRKPWVFPLEVFDECLVVFDSFRVGF